MPYVTIETAGPVMPQAIESMLSENPALFASLESMAADQISRSAGIEPPLDPLTTESPIVRISAAIISKLAAVRISSLSADSLGRIDAAYEEALALLAERAAAGTGATARAWTEYGANESESGAEF